MINERERLEALCKLAKEYNVHPTPILDTTVVRELLELEKVLARKEARKKAAEQFDMNKPYDI